MISCVHVLGHIYTKRENSEGFTNFHFCMFLDLQHILKYFSVLIKKPLHCQIWTRLSQSKISLKYSLKFMKLLLYLNLNG